MRRSKCRRTFCPLGAALGAKGAKENAAWKAALGQSPAERSWHSISRPANRAPPLSRPPSPRPRIEFAGDATKRATRIWSQMTLEHLVPVLPELIGGSADLTPSNGTRTKHHTAVTPGSFGGNYIHYGVREHGMAAAMNGLALHGSIMPYGATFLVFTDYCRPSIRLSALMHQRVIYVMTHDSIGLGEDGPTHQPDRASGRAARHSEPLGAASGRCAGNCRSLGDRPHKYRAALDPGADASGGADGAAH